MIDRRLVFRVEYDGTGFHGWQTQPGLPTIQESLNNAIVDVVGEASLVGASRTDSGVHARDQLASSAFFHPIRCRGFCKAVNRRLPNAIAIRDAHDVPLDFELLRVRARKTYVYRLYTSNDPHPLRDRTAWRLRWAIDGDRIAAAARHLVGEHDFVSFAAANHGRSSTVRTIYSLQVDPDGQGGLALRFSGSGFLKQMVRNLMGTLVEVGRSMREPDDVKRILEARSRSAAGFMAPPQGLELERVWWHPVTGYETE